MNRDFCRILKELRLNMSIGQVELASKLKVSNGIISMWENGLREPTMSSLVKIADFFEVSIDYLVGITNIKTINRSRRLPFERTDN